jgi:hypothetical protein
MKCALHVHTNLSDAAFAPEEVVKIYADLGFGAVAITDHEFLLRDNYVTTITQLPRYGMIVLAGVELDYPPWNYQHLIRIQGEHETLHLMPHPASYYLELDEVRARLHSEPFAIDAIEITHRGFHTPLYDTAALAIPKIATDDAHEPGDCGRAWIETPDTTDPDRLIRAIRAGDCQPQFFRNSKTKR